MHFLDRFNLAVSDLWCTVKRKESSEEKTFTAIFFVFVDSQQDEASLLFSIIMRLSEQASSQFLGQLDPIF